VKIRKYDSEYLEALEVNPSLKVYLLGALTPLCPASLTYHTLRVGLKCHLRASCCRFVSATEKLRTWPCPVQMFEELEDLRTI